MKTVLMSLCCSCCFLLILSNNAMAFGDGTPDTDPPAEETVCDSFTGAAFGLCNAGCEAMDCGDPGQSASETACDKVNAKFMKITGSDLPCIGGVCSADDIERCGGEEKFCIDFITGECVLVCTNRFSDGICSGRTCTECTP